MKFVVITGAAGFIGSNLTKECLQQGLDVVGIDNLSTGRAELADPKQYEGLPGHYSFIKKDITDPDLVDYFKDAEVVFHLAARPRVSYSIERPLESNHSNITGTLNVLEAARRAGVKRVVFSSSSSIYGGAAHFPTPEAAEPHPLSPYALHKQTGEHYCRIYSELHRLDTVCLRYFNVIGPNQYPGGAYSTVIPAFFDAAFSGQSCRIDGDGTQSRDFCPVENVVQANLLAALHDKPLKGEIFNVACGETHSVGEIFDIINGFFGGTLQKTYAPRRLGDPMKSHADISKITKQLGYKPTVLFKEGMGKTYEFWRYIYKWQLLSEK